MKRGEGRRGEGDGKKRKEKRRRRMEETWRWDGWQNGMDMFIIRKTSISSVSSNCINKALNSRFKEFDIIKIFIAADSFNSCDLAFSTFYCGQNT